MRRIHLPPDQADQPDGHDRGRAMPDNADLSGPPALPVFAYVIIALCVGVEMLNWAGQFDLLATPRLRNAIFEFFGFWPGLLDGWRENYPGQRFFMFFTYGFLHGGLLHLGMNMYTLWVMSGPIAERVGQWGFASVYLGSMVGGAIGYALLSPAPLPMVGASGALFGLAGAITAWVVHDSKGWDALRALARISAYLIAMNVVFWWALNGHLAWQTHLGGFLVGALLGHVLDRPARAGRA